MLKNSRHVIAKHLCDLFNAIRTTSMCPDMWSKASISPLKKKDIKVSLLCIHGKVFTKNSRMMYWATSQQQMVHTREGKSTIDHIFTLMAMAQKYMSRPGGRLY